MSNKRLPVALFLDHAHEYFFEYGLNTFLKDGRYTEKDLKTNTPGAYDLFRQCVFSGWKIGQAMVAPLQLAITNQPNFQSSPISIYQLRILQRLLDSIIWYHFEDVTEPKRIFSGPPLTVNLEKHNFHEHYQMAREINQSHDKFALVTDLTSGTSSGDLFIVSQNGYQFVEVKTGKVNSEIFEAIKSGNPEKIEAIKKVTPETAKQVDRIVRQHERGQNLSNIIRTGSGIDNQTGLPFSVTHSSEKRESFAEEVIWAMSEAVTKGQAEVVVDDCLLVFAMSCNRDRYNEAEVAFRESCSKFSPEYEHDFRADYFSTLLRSPVLRPPFLQPLKKEHVMSMIERDLFFGIHFSPERFRKKFDGNECEFRWVDGREFRRQWPKRKVYAMRFGERALELKLKGEDIDIWLSNGLFLRVPSYLTRPVTFFKMHVEMLKSFLEMKQKK